MRLAVLKLLADPRCPDTAGDGSIFRTSSVALEGPGASELYCGRPSRFLLDGRSTLKWLVDIGHRAYKGEIEVRCVCKSYLFTASDDTMLHNASIISRNSNPSYPALGRSHGIHYLDMLAAENIDSFLDLERPKSTPPYALDPHPTRCSAPDPTVSRACVDVQDLLVPPEPAATDVLCAPGAHDVV